jgi:signal transduction histidine kinase
MGESYSDDDASGAPHEAALARELIARLVPRADAGLLVRGLLAERSSPRTVDADEPHGGAERDPAARELQRVRLQIALGEEARAARHALNNPLTALLAEAQLLELEPLAEEHRDAVVRMLELVRRIAKVTRRLDSVGVPTIG